MLAQIDDNRTFARMDVASDVKFKINGENSLCEGELLNLSAQGLAFEAQHNLAQDTQLFLEVNSGGNAVPPLMANATVVRCDELSQGTYHIACTMKISA